ncbi:MAG: SDR family NAD(P)-dependent oxidoreductase [Usitatibacteraceae bacterium]
MNVHSDTPRPALLLSGAGAGLGASVAASFAADYDVIGVARSEQGADILSRRVSEHGGRYTHLTADLTDPEGLAAALEPHLTRIEVVVHNAAALLLGAFEKTSVADFERIWRTTCLSAFNAAQIVLPQMATRQRGVFIFSGATASIRGSANFAAFASAKFAMRGLAQSLAREYAPRGVHVAHVLLDGQIDSVKTTQRSGAAVAQRMDPDAIADAYFFLAGQPRSAWTQELDLRTAVERF